VQINNGTQSTHYTYIDLGVGDVTNKQLIRRGMMVSTTGEVNADVLMANQTFIDCYWPVPAGAEIWIRGRNSAAPVAGYNATVIGIGG
jgi:hypothetical protein